MTAVVVTVVVLEVSHSTHWSNPVGRVCNFAEVSFHTDPVGRKVLHMTSNELKLTMLVSDIAHDRLLTIRQSLDSFERLMQLYLNFSPSIDFTEACYLKRIGCKYVRNIHTLRAFEEVDIGDVQACEKFHKSLQQVCEKTLKQFELALTKTLERKS